MMAFRRNLIDEDDDKCCYPSKGHVAWVPICEPCDESEDCRSTTSHSIIATSAVLGLIVVPLCIKVIMGRSWFTGGSRRTTRAVSPPPLPPPPPPPPPPEPSRLQPKFLFKYFVFGLLVAIRAYQYHFKSPGPANRLT
ncbi:hypothetical protein R1flu_012330 [Riccia fluitans]|uniref:Uncharacterized protein n=1 Tax=Riccia fluitans TaxID=41844 RepID=A0ABD1ZAA7_9MARC